MHNRIPIVKIAMYLVFPLCLLSRCDFALEKTKNKGYEQVEAVLEINEEQGMAFDALNLIQVSTDRRNLFYSTYANIEQPFYPADTSFEVSQDDLHKYMQEYLYRYCTKLPKEQQAQLARESVLAQEEYIILHCSKSNGKSIYEEGLPMSDTWVIPNVLGKRDIVLLW